MMNRQCSVSVLVAVVVVSWLGPLSGFGGLASGAQAIPALFGLISP
jgi:hypothetical protein